jgi:hypothetical protein
MTYMSKSHIKLLFQLTCSSKFYCRQEDIHGIHGVLWTKAQPFSGPDSAVAYVSNNSPESSAIDV